jgi:hypothetical protein
VRKENNDLWTEDDSVSFIPISTPNASMTAKRNGYQMDDLFFKVENLRRDS